MLIAIDAIRESDNLRRVKPPPGADEALEASIRAQGVLQPVLVRADGDGYVLVAGHRRLRCARAAGLTDIPAEVQQMTDRWALAAQASENMVRLALHPVDQWRAVRDLVAGGMSIPAAATALGLDDRRTRRMERLGNLDPKVLELIEMSGAMPADHYLATIANAPRATQAKAAKAKDATEVWNGQKRVQWHVIAERCKVTRYSRSDAIFDTGAMTWDVDLFAEPGSDDEYTTTDRDTFMRLQRGALDAQIEADRAKKKRIQIAELDQHGTVKLPPGFTRVWHSDPDKPKRGETVFVAIRADGAIDRAVGENAASKNAAEAKNAKRTGAAETPAEDGEGDDDGDLDPSSEPDDTPLPAAEKPGLTKAGLAQVAAAKTQALRETLRKRLVYTPTEQLLVLMVLAWGALNVSVSNAEQPDGNAYDPDRRHFADLAARILLPGGAVDQITLTDARGLAGEIMARVLSFGTPGAGGFTHGASGAPAEWIGAAIGAETLLPRFDTAEFLAQVGGDELRRAATAAGEKATGTVKSLRERLAGKMPDWRPDGAVFGAPAPVMRKTREIREDAA